MAQDEQPQVYLITPPEIELSRFRNALENVLDTHEVACVRLALASRDEDAICRAADACREVTHARDIALVIENHILLVERLGLDGVHLTDGSRSVRKARKELGADAIVGAFCGTSQHDGMTAGEAGADYISFGPAGGSDLGSGEQAPADLFEWWSQMIELPVVAEGNLDENVIRTLAPATDFLGIGDEIWQNDNPAARLGALLAEMSA
jgi:thiamine-phosphate pyrophosphorylase